MNNVIEMSYNGSEIRSIDIDGQIWWVLKDVCKILELSNPSKVASRLDEDERSNFELGRQGKTIVINESGLYSVILRSDKPEAKPFRRWITHEVLPEIRRTGSYNIPERKSECKTWYGVPVLTVSDIAERLGVCRDTARKRVFRCMRNGLDFFILSGYSLQLFKFENRDVSVTSSQILLVRKEEFEKIMTIKTA